MCGNILFVCFKSEWVQRMQHYPLQILLHPLGFVGGKFYSWLSTLVCVFLITVITWHSENFIKSLHLICISFEITHLRWKDDLLFTLISKFRINNRDAPKCRRQHGRAWWPLDWGSKDLRWKLPLVTGPPWDFHNPTLLQIQSHVSCWGLVTDAESACLQPCWIRIHFITWTWHTRIFKFKSCCLILTWVSISSTMKVMLIRAAPIPTRAPNGPSELVYVKGFISLNVAFQLLSHPRKLMWLTQILHGVQDSGLDDPFQILFF